jgi:hypothetical protein
MIGTVVKGIGGFYFVYDGETVVMGKARGNLKRNKDLIYVGDVVDFDIDENDKDGECVIHRVVERKNYLTRPPVSNLDILVVVFSLVQPDVNYPVIDKLIAGCELAGIDPVICISKADLAGKDAVFYVAVEYAVQYTLPEYTRDFVVNTLKYQPKKEFYGGDAALLEEFEAYVRDYLVQQMAPNVEKAKSAALWEHLTDKAVCGNLPADEVSYYFGVYEAEVEYYYEYYVSYGGETFKAQYPDLDTFAVVYFGFGKGADWKAELTEMAEQLVCRDMITHAIAEREGMETVSEEEFETQVQYWVEYYSARYGAMAREDILSNMGEVFLRESAFADKMDAWLMAQATFTYEDGTPIVSTTENQA